MTCDPLPRATEPALYTVPSPAYDAHRQTALPVPVPVSGAVELPGERGPMVWVPGPDGGFVCVPRDMLPAGYLHTTLTPAPPQRDLTAQPALDPTAQRVLAGGLAAGAAGAGLGWGIGQAAAGVAAISGSTTFVAVLALLLLAKLTHRGSSGDGATTATNVHYETTVINHNRWLGRSTTNS